MSRSAHAPVEVHPDREGGSNPRGLRGLRGRVTPARGVRSRGRGRLRVSGRSDPVLLHAAGLLLLRSGERENIHHTGQVSEPAWATCTGPAPS